jgi:hypothetical protein
MFLAFLFLFQFRFSFVVFFFIDLAPGKPLSQYIKRAIFMIALAWYAKRQGKYPNNDQEPDKPPYPVHAPIILIVPHDFTIYVYE